MGGPIFILLFQSPHVESVCSHDQGWVFESHQECQFWSLVFHCGSSGASDSCTDCASCSRTEDGAVGGIGAVVAPICKVWSLAKILWKICSSMAGRAGGGAMEELLCAAVIATAFPSGGIDSDAIPSVVGTVAIAEGWGPLYAKQRVRYQYRW